MVNAMLYSAIEFASGFAPSFTAFLVLRARYGVAMAASGASARNLSAVSADGLLDLG